MFELQTCKDYFWAKGMNLLQHYCLTVFIVGTNLMLRIIQKVLIDAIQFEKQSEHVMKLAWNLYMT